ncbi:VirB3 family type IV secretion system protein [Hellea sp.]|nr:VirB3 family type IV secretion system protein [Hellea sp.]
MDAAQHIEGFNIPVHRSVTQPIMMAGAPRAATILNGTLAAALSLGLQLWPVGLVIWGVSQTACVFAAKRDPLFLDVLRRHLCQKSYLS